VYRQPKNYDDPVQITKVMEGGNEIVQGVFEVPPYETQGGNEIVQGEFQLPPYETPRQPIPASDDWIENLSISFKNLTSIKIEFMRIHFCFFYGEDRNDLQHVVGWDLDLGRKRPVNPSFPIPFQD
jgi:hypothetical protein